MLQAFVQNVSSVSDVCCKRFDLDVVCVSHICSKSMFQIFQLFHSYVAVSIFTLQVFYLDVADVSHICCKSMFEMFQSYVAISVLCCKLQLSYLGVAYSHTCCKCMFQIFHVLQTYVAFKCFMLQVFHVSELCLESHEGTAWAPGEGARRAEGRRMGRATCLGFCGRGVTTTEWTCCPGR